MKKLLTGLFVFSAVAFGQITYSANKTTSLSGAAEVVTVQQPASGKLIEFVGVSVDCTVACAFTIERNGTAATTTSLTVVNVNPSETSPTAVAFSGSNSTGGTVIGRYSLAAGGAAVIDLRAVKIQATHVNKNLTIRTNSITGTVDINIVFTER